MSRFRWLALAVVTSGCGFHGNAHSDAGALPGSEAGLALDAAADAAIDAPIDAIDLCKVANNPTAPDEDGDGIIDTCDRCPQLASSTLDPDTDGDGIGDPCDPNPTVAGDTVAYWNGFDTDGALPAGIAAVLDTPPASWTVSGGALRNTTGDAPQAIIIDAHSANHTIDLGLDLVSGVAGIEVASALTDLAADDTSFIHCGPRPDIPRRELWDYGETTVNTWTDRGSDTSETVTLPGSYRVVSRVANGTAKCAIPSATMAHAFPSPPVTLHGSTNVGVRNRNLTIAIRYVMVYASP